MSDADGDGVMTDMDNYGYICYGELAADLLFRGAGVKYVDKDPETGRLIDGTSGEKTVDVYSKIYRLLWGGNTTFDIRQSRFSSYLRGKWRQNPGRAVHGRQNTVLLRMHGLDESAPRDGSGLRRSSSSEYTMRRRTDTTPLCSTPICR